MPCFSGTGPVKMYNIQLIWDREKNLTQQHSLNLELNIKEWKVEVPIIIQTSKKSNYNKVLVEDLYSG
jgi:hypothetical protein